MRGGAAWAPEVEPDAAAILQESVRKVRHVHMHIRVHMPMHVPMPMPMHMHMHSRAHSATPIAERTCGIEHMWN